MTSLPWHVRAPIPDVMGHSVWDNHSNIVCECFGDDSGREQAIEICRVQNLSGPKICRFCGKKAGCFGAYEDGFHPAYSCSDCCGHGNEDGWCEPVTP